MTITDQDIQKIRKAVLPDLLDIKKTVGGLEMKTDQLHKAVGGLEMKISHLPTKDEFYEQTSEILSRLTSQEDENLLQAEHISRLDDRVTILESTRPHGKTMS